MEMNDLTKGHLKDRYFSEEELMDLGMEYTSQNFSKYLIFKKDNKYYLLDEVQHNKFKVEFNFEEQN